MAVVTIVVVAVGLVVLTVRVYLDWRWNQRLKDNKPDVIAACRKVAARVKPVLVEQFRKAHVPFPPDRLMFLAFKAERNLEVWAQGEMGPWRHIHTYPILGLSGGPGPKLREGDKQVPEGIYAIQLLNPKSNRHLSLRLDYPNAFDSEKAAEEGRAEPGTDIYIHGGDTSVGCLAIGDPAIEELFYLVAFAGKENVQVVIAPNDARDGRELPTPDNAPKWLDDVHASIRAAWQELQDN